jgi:hypothetical protein
MEKIYKNVNKDLMKHHLRDHNSYSSPNYKWKVRLARHTERVGPITNEDRILDHLMAADRYLDCLDLKETGNVFGLSTVAQDSVQQQAAFCKCGNKH